MACSSKTPTNITSNKTFNSNCRIVQHEMGETCIPLNPQRVVGLGNTGFFALDLGVEPVGIVHSPLVESLGLKSQVRDIEDIGNPPNLEKLVALKPDLIFSWGHQEIYSQLSQIAPTVLKDWENSGGWKEMLMFYADLLGKTDVAEQLMADYNQRIAEFQQRMGEGLEQVKVSVVRVRRPGEFALELKHSFSGTIIEDIGLGRPPAQDKDKFALYNLSKERITDADGDIIFVWTYGSKSRIAQKAESALETLKADPLWLQLEAVQQNKVYEVPGYWIGYNMRAANLVLDDLFEYLIEE